MKLSTFEVPTPIEQVQRIGLLIQNRIVDLNIGYTCYLHEKRGSNRAYELASVTLPNNMIDFFRKKQGYREAAETIIEYLVHSAKCRLKAASTLHQPLMVEQYYWSHHLPLSFLPSKLNSF